ncbi:MAG: PilZ domain-containing protein [Candidatus Omnitrophota bacterium]|nr:PilZ domain-containing protein [Candidatus Omnitrophota bacterium]MBU2258203.1 PilZ domain-containing protein [Candidatus Omnitrophota bacterium]
MEEKYGGPERRMVARLDQKIPVEYIFINDNPRRELSEKYSSYIRNFTYSGALLVLDKLNENWIEDLTSGITKIDIDIKIPAYSAPIKAIARVVWLEKKEEPEKSKYLLGLTLTEITDSDMDRIKNYMIDFYSGGVKKL